MWVGAENKENLAAKNLNHNPQRDGSSLAGS